MLRILCLVGSPTDDAMRELSELYARGCIDALGPCGRYAFVVAHVSPDGAWRFPHSLAPDAIAEAPATDFGGAMERLAAGQFDLALPQMFCHAGMTTYRSLLELLGLPYLGNPPLQMALAADKAKTRAIVGAAGVPVPAGELLRPGESPVMAPPVVVKPNAGDNSDGVSLVLTREEYPAALAMALDYDGDALVERYVPLGREVRCGIVVRQGRLECLPVEEYRVDANERPIRTRAHKLRRDGAGALYLAAKDRRESWIVAGDDPIVAAVHEAARRAHLALGCRQYSLFDFRIDPEGRPWFLEAGLYCSFSPQSVIPVMAAAAGIALDALFAAAVDDLLSLAGSDPNRAATPTVADSETTRL